MASAEGLTVLPLSGTPSDDDVTFLMDLALAVQRVRGGVPLGERDVEVLCASGVVQPQ